MMNNIPSEWEFRPIAIGNLSIWPPVVLAPMAGVTNFPFRTICNRFGVNLCIGEMVTARALVQGGPKTAKLTYFGPQETIRSLQLAAVDPYYMGEAVKCLVNEHRIDLIDLNFGCPVRKITRKGGGAAVPLKPFLLRNIIHSAVRNSGSVPVTAKFRIGIDDEHSTYLTSGRIAQEEGCAAVCLHARTAAQLYSGDASWENIAALKRVVDQIPVLGNGDIWEPRDAVKMMRMTQCDGVAIGRGCLGRPWLFRQLEDVFNGTEHQPLPDFGQVVDIMLEHATLLSDFLGEESGIRAFRRHSTWYTKGYSNSAQLRKRCMQVKSLLELRAVLANVDREQTLTDEVSRVPRGKASKTQKVSLPQGYLEGM